MTTVPRFDQQLVPSGSQPPHQQTISAGRTKYALTPRAKQSLDESLPSPRGRRHNTNQLANTSMMTTPRPGVFKPVDQEEPRVLTARDLRSINNYISCNKTLQHQHRSGKVSELIPRSAFQKLEDNSDTSLGLRLAPINTKESALDVPLRFAPPESYHAPALKDLHAGSALSQRLVSMLKGSSGVPQHWEGEKEGVERDFNHNNIIKDLEMKANMAKRANDMNKHAQALFAISALHYNSGHRSKAARMLTETSNVFEQIGSAQGAALCQNIIGVCYMHRGEYKTALTHHRKQDTLGGPYARCVAQINMGVCYAALGEHEFSEQAFTDALRNGTDANDSVLEAIARGNLGIAYMRLGNMRSAQSQFEACLEQCSVAGDKVGAAVCMLLLGQVHAECGDSKHAQYYFEHTLRVATEAQVQDVADVAKVSVGIARANQAARDAMFQQAKKMGGDISVAELMLALPKY